MSLWQTGRRDRGLQPHEARAAFAQLSQRVDGQHPAGLDRGGDGRERNGAAAQHAWIWAWLDALPKAACPAVLRGDVAYGNESVLREAEARDQPYVTKLRLTKHVKDLIKKLFRRTGWADAGQGWEGVEDTLTLTGWSRARRVVVLRRKLSGEMLLTGTEDRQNEFAFIEGAIPTARHEYAGLVTSTQHAVLTLAQLYRDRADAENNFDELKKQWGWGGYTTQDLARCRLMARMVALVYNWWNLFVRLAQPHKHFAAITSRPLLLHGVATQTRHGGQTRLTITSTHAKRSAIQAVLTNWAGFLTALKTTAEQWTDVQRLHAILERAFAKFMLTTAGPPAGLTAKPNPILTAQLLFLG